MIKSPLTNSENVTLLKTLLSEQLISDWKKSFNIDISNELKNYDKIYLYQCNDSQLKFFIPFDIAGSDKLYEQLQKFYWYYMPRKWEHDMAIQDLLDSEQILEVGCGKGAFVSRLSQEYNLNALGIELNKNAVKYAQNLGISVIEKNIYDLASEKPNSFDAICTFQVLEHIPNFLQFIEAMIKLLKPNGKLIISVPNSLSFSKYSENNLLDQPPHHVTQWNEIAFRELANKFSLKIKHFKLEPLAEYHVDWYVATQLSRLPNIRLIKSIAYRIGNKIIKPLLNLSIIRNLIIGHTIYVCFEK
ncbi:class I SAM-dependent methyltransferase [Geminocystis sp. CENA526]|uniref:class I SAM-dependent methyltransferase n=1 Tax=Geminocystis sp. CENA526 TaxID=1355871 RepID=UPI003D6FF1DD